MVVGSRTTLQASAFDAAGNSLAGHTVVWGSSPSSAATVDENGVVTAVSLGEMDVTASIAGAAGSVHVVVLARTP